MTGDNTALALVVGEALVDIVADDGGAVGHHPGGSCANVAVALARLERSTVLATELGPDELGDLVRAHLTDSGVRLLVGEHTSRTSSALARIDAAGAATYEFDIDWRFDAEVVTVAPSVVHVGSIAAVFEPGAAAVRQVVERLRPSAHISYDVNARPALMTDAVATRASVEELVSLAHVVKASDEDAAFLYRDLTLEQVSRHWLGLGPAAVVFTRGAEGSIVFTPLGRAEAAARATNVVDTIGAGDTFSAGLIDALWPILTSSPAAEPLAALTLEEWQAALEHASHLASVTVSRRGANPPWLSELTELGLLR